MAGSDPRFNPTTFRDAIHFVMAMAQPSATEDQLVFKWIDRNTFAEEGPPSAPFNWGSTPVTSHTWGPVLVPAAYQMTYRTGQTQGTPLGDFDQPLLVVTVLDVDYPLIFDDRGVRADQIEIPDKTLYEILFEAPPEALFDVTVYTVYARALEAA